MNLLVNSELGRAQLALLLTTLVYFAMNGAQIFETAVLIPKWSAAPPESFGLLRGPYALDLKTFWIVAHSVHELTFIAAIVLCWKLELRNPLLVLFALHLAVRVWTLAYFAPQIIDFQAIATVTESPVDLTERVQHWRSWNYLRVGIFLAVSFGMVPLCLRASQLGR